MRLPWSLVAGHQGEWERTRKRDKWEGGEAGTEANRESEDSRRDRKRDDRSEGAVHSRRPVEVRFCCRGT